MSFQALNSALSGLRTAQLQLNTISNNVSNVGTEGYTRKILPQSSQVLESTGEVIGVQSETIIRNVDLNLARDLWTQISAVSALDVKQSYLDRIVSFHGTPDSEISIAAELSDLKDTIASLADNPNDTFLQRTVLEQAETVAGKFNDFGDLITTMRNDAQDEMEVTVERVNGLLEQIAQLNDQIRSAINLNRSSADLEDLRDQAVKELSDEMSVTFFQRGDGVLVVQSSTGVLLADERATELYFDPTIIGATSIYPDSVAGLYAGGNPVTTPGAFDISQTNLGGRLGALIELRDETLPTYQAQVDELAHKTALRFEEQGLRLFTDANGFVPADTPPEIDPSLTTPVEYVGFASTIQVNELIISDNSLLQSGTYTSDVPILNGSSEILSRVLEFTFGDTAYQQAIGTVDITIASSGSADLQEHLGLYSQNQVVIGPDLTEYTEIDSAGANTTDLITALSEYALSYPANDEFQIQLYDRSGAPTAATLSIDLSDLGTNPLYAIGQPDPSGTLSDGTIDNALDQLVALVNATIISEEGFGNIPIDLQARASINAFGQFTIESRGDIEFISTGFANAMGSDTFQGIFGTTAQLFETEHPYFDIQIGGEEPVRITIEPGEDETDLLAKLEKLTAADAGVPGLLVDDIAFAGGTLTLRPGLDDTAFSGPQFGGSMQFIAGQGSTDGSGVAAAGANIIEALFGSATPITSVDYQSEEYQVTGVGSGTYVPFRYANLGQGANISTGLVSGDTLVDYAQKMITAQSQDLNAVNQSYEDEDTLRDLLETRLLNESAVNIDEELSNLILVQTAYSAAARTVTAVDELFEELLNAVR